LFENATLKRSPTLRKLLQFLVDQTIAGRAADLKSYVVAIDALGRSEDFDPSSDSYARVQMIRLRRVLENYYAQNPPVAGNCVHIPAGSYEVRLDPASVAYPALYRINGETKDPQQSRDGTANQFAKQSKLTKALVAQPAALSATVVFTTKFSTIAVSTLLLASILFIIYILMDRLRGEETSGHKYFSPIIEIMPIEVQDDPNFAVQSRIVQENLAVNLPRFVLTRVRVVTQTRNTTKSEGDANVYRLFARLVADQSERPALFLNISDASNDTTIWSRTVKLPRSTGELQKSLIPIYGEISGPLGIIAERETGLTQNDTGGGYPCLLKFFEFVRAHESAMEKKVAACFKKRVDEPALQATILGVRATFELERSSAHNDRQGAVRRGLVFARRAVAVSPNDAWANFALARLSFVAGDCGDAKFYADRTMEINPNSPIFATGLAAMAPACNLANSDELFNQALFAQSPYFARGRLLLIATALMQDRPDKIAEVVESDTPDTPFQISNNYLSRSLIAVSKGNRREANRYWRLFSAAQPRDRRTPKEKLAPYAAIPQMQDKILAYLVDNGVAVTP
jgi:hypothetical protein